MYTSVSPSVLYLPLRIDKNLQGVYVAENKYAGVGWNNAWGHFKRMKIIEDIMNEYI